VATGAVAADKTTSPFAALQSSGTPKTAASDANAASERFLKLLVAQMQNQDPLAPMDNAQVTSQMAQINTVSGIEKLNTTVQALSSQFSTTQAVQGAALIGKDVVVPGNRLDVVSAKAADGTTVNVGQGGFELSGAADHVKVEILAPSGTVVETLNLGAAGAGMHSFDWAAGAATADSGYTFRVTATAGGVATTSTALMRDSVTAVATGGTELRLELARSGSVAWSAVKALN
jgi:flagellar basal-body rod modification protein FlgD